MSVFFLKDILLFPGYVCKRFEAHDHFSLIETNCILLKYIFIYKFIILHVLFSYNFNAEFHILQRIEIPKNIRDCHN